MTKGEPISDCVTLYSGDCRDMLAELPDNSVDSCVTDPPYHLTSIVKRFSTTSESDDTKTSERVRNRSDGYARLVAGGFMGKKWDGGDIAFRPDVWRDVFRVLKPGGHVLAFGGTRTYHRMTCAIEDAGFEIRDCIQWIYGSGFPKSLDVSKAMDRSAGAEREYVGEGQYAARKPRPYEGGNALNISQHDPRIGHPITAPATDAAKQWEGWGTALKPACEPIVLARKPLIGTVAENVLQHGTGALNIDGCRIASGDTVKPRGSSKLDTEMHEGWARPWMENREEVQRRHDAAIDRANTIGRWPANVIHDGSEEVVEAFPIAPGQGGGVRGDEPSECHSGVYSGPHNRLPFPNRGDDGSAARFFYTAKADSDDRLGSKHPTVKPLDLIQYLVRLITPPGGTVLDPFAGTGTTGEAAFREGMKAILIEWEAEYQEDIRRRMKLLLAGPDERAIAAIKAREKDKPIDPGPLFSLTIQRR